ncbi:nucleoside triphosphate pyrophosphohydrolase [Treponema sp.]|uniref:nucleoside triphosphate pyrophosphohydrolase n=1 Tax=Treponema sp. TaxID=166 RepID=UPI0025EF18F9|nr:nucleoside triphosphate pyrophosphohydrolase [Treponema sp.]MCR5218450.1 nucleoside triphosphate pyrophosphohydrolase [Treponema sp.]
MTDNENKTAEAFKKLYEITNTLTSENGCPWDKDQTALSLRRDLIEESFEVSDAVTSKDAPHVKEELGDVLFNVMLMASTFEKSEEFTLSQIIEMVSEKLIRRHPHVFKDSEGFSEMTGAVKDSKTVLSQWDRIKENIEGRKGESVLDSVPEDFPPLLKAYKYVSKAAKKGFTWKNADEAKAKLKEELNEIQDAVNSVEGVKKSSAEIPFTVSSSNKKLEEAQLNLEEEIGDSFLALVNYSRMLGVDPMIALDHANRKFSKRFRAVEKEINKAEKKGKDITLEDMCRHWNDAKKKK